MHIDVRTIPGVVPMVYKLAYGDLGTGEKEYHLLPKLVRFKPESLVGKIKKEPEKVLKVFHYMAGGTQVINTGKKGMGKSTFIETLANTFIDMGYPVVYVSEIDIDIKTLEYLSRLTGCVLMLDEFGKNINVQLQEKMLSMLSTVPDVKRLILASENHTSAISDFIIGRCFRLMFHYEFDRADKETLDEICDNTPYLKEEYRKNIYTKWKMCPEFSIDNLKGILLFHEIFPDETLEDNLYRLNAGALSKPPLIKIVSITKKGVKLKPVLDKDGKATGVTEPELDKDGKEIPIDIDVNFNYTDDITKGEFDGGYSCWIKLRNEDDYSISLYSRDIKDIADDNMSWVCERGIYTVEMSIK